MPVLASLAVSSLALSSAVAVAPAELPLRKLRLYETGVGYFERRGRTQRGGKVALPLPASHLDDALKSLVILQAEGDVKIEGVQFDSSVSEDMARALAGLPTEDHEPLSYDTVLTTLKGSRVELRADGARIRGRLVDLEGPFYVEPVRPHAEQNSGATNDAAPPKSEPHFTLIVLDDDSALRRIKTDRIDAITVLDEQTANRLEVAATALSDQSARQESQLEVQVGRGGALGLGYISESPVWRTTYRVVMDREHESGQLQAWALVHNDTDENWNNVMVELANGRPASFLHPLAAPRYAPRELLDPPEGLTTVPQLANNTVDGLMGEMMGESFGIGSVGLIGKGGGGGGMASHSIGLGYGTETGGIELSDLADLAQAAGSESGALFLYRVADPVDIEAHHSALLPIVQDDIEVESITLFSAMQDEGLSAARLVNTTKQTLPPGTVSFFAEGGFVGEAVFDRLKPDERRFVPYGFELDVELTRQSEVVGESVAVLRYDEGTLVEHYLQETKLTLELHNRSGGSRRVYAELDISRRAELRGDGKAELDYDLANDAPLAATTVAAGQTRRHTLHAKQLERRRHGVINRPLLRALASKSGTPDEQRALLRKALGHADRSRELDEQTRKAHEEISTVERDIARQRKNLSALGDAGVRGGTRARVSRDLLDKELRIIKLRKQIEQNNRDSARLAKRQRSTLAKLNDWQP